MFYDRYEAGRDVAEMLVQYKGTDAVICAIPRGGILTGVAVAKQLELPLEIMLVSSSEHPSAENSLYCIVTEYGTQVCGSDDELPESQVQQAVATAKKKRLDYTDSETLPDWKNKTVLVVDDGAESGLTIKAVVEALKQQKPKKIVVALPAASGSVTQWLEEQVDEGVVLDIEPEFTGVIQAHYSHYPEVSDKEVHVAYWHAKHMYEHKQK